MSKVMGSLLALILCSLVVAVPSVRAYWIQDGVPLCTASGTQRYCEIISDGTGGAIVTWQDFRSASNYDVYAQRVDASGTVQWTIDGVALCTATGYQIEPKITSDGAGGAIIAWDDERAGSDIYAQRISAGGVVQWTTNGVPVCTASGTQQHCDIISDGAGGAIIVWEDERNGNWDICAQRMNSSGSVLWTADGVFAISDVADQWYPAIVSDGAGGAIVTWADLRSGGSDIYAQRISAFGDRQWGMLGNAICTTTGSTNPAIASDGAGGALIVWQDNRNGNSDIYIQRVDAGGAVYWAANGVSLCTATGDQTYPEIVLDGAGGTIVAWNDARGVDMDIYAQRLLLSLGYCWMDDGMPLCMESGDQYSPTLVSDDAGGVIAAWIDERSGSEDIFAQHVSQWGTFQWTMNGIVICTAWSYQRDPVIDRDGAGGAVVAWSDLRGGSYDIYSQAVDQYGRIGFIAPEIFSIRDVPGDQGGAVYLSWYAARPDVFMDNDMSYYSLWRAIGPTSSLAALDDGTAYLDDLSELDAAACKRVIRIERAGGLTYFWELVETVDALYMEAYGKPVATLYDSTAVCTEYHYFQVVAHTTDPKVFWKSEPDSGYSVDNLAPCSPSCLAGEQSFTPAGLDLTWNRNTEPDLDDYRVYRGLMENFVPGAGNLVASSCDTAYFDGEWRWDDGYYYKVSAVDVHGNESGFALLRPEDVTGFDTPKAPEMSYLAQNYPNPFNPMTRIVFGLSAPERVNLRIYDVSGHLVKELVNEACQAGIYEEIWDGRDGAGRKVASGIYLYRLRAGSFESTRKMILLR